ncbi:MAG: EF-P lysine aminoacylase GenX [Archangium sp.]|nr:EF-P lysine aminoacylase GenX [Archangium sp.]
MPTPAQWEAARARQQLYAALRAWFSGAGYLEVETPCLVPTPGMEPHIDPFSVRFTPELGVGQARALYLHTSPEYAMKRLLADGSPPLFQLCKTFRNGEVAAGHNPEFTMLEFYRPHADYVALMADVESLLSSVPGSGPFARTPYERLTVRDAVKRHAGIDLAEASTGPLLKAAAEARGIHTGASTAFDDVFFHVFLSKVESQLGRERPTFLIEYPASMAALARVKPGDASVAERVELYVGGVELANGFSELTDAVEQRRRLVEEQAQRRAAGKVEVALDEAFLEALPRMPPSAGIAIGIDRVLMVLRETANIADVLLFPARDFV